MSSVGESCEKQDMTSPDVEKNLPTADITVSDSESKNAWWSKISTWGVEVRGIVPVPIEERTDGKFVNIFSLWWTMSVSLLPIITGMSGTLSYGLSLRDASLIILFFSLIAAIPPAYLATLGPKTGMRQMVQARFSFGLYLVSVPVLLNLATITGFVIIDSVIGGQTLAAVNPGSISSTVGIVIVAIIAVFISFFGYRILHIFERYAWIPSLIALIIATGCGGKHLSQQTQTESPAVGTVFSFGGLIAGYLIPWGAMSSDFSTYMRPNAPPLRIFAYTYAGLFAPTVVFLILGAAIGGATPNIPSWNDGYNAYSGGGVLAAMLSPAGGFGQFVVVLLAFSILGNIAASFYSITLNFQILIPYLVRVPRFVFSILMLAVVIPVSVVAARSFFDSLQNFIGVIGYWSAAFVAIIIVEHLVFRRRCADPYPIDSWDVAAELPTGIAALAAGALSFALIIPCMSEVWYTGPLAETTGDIGFEVAFVLSAVLYLPFRALEVKILGRI